MIKVQNLYYKYEDKFILENINIEVKEGFYTAIIGSNGSGKTTLIKHFNSLLLPTKGTVTVDGLSTKKDSLEVRKMVGMLFQNPEDQLINSVVEEDIAFGLENLNISSKEIISRVDKILKRLYIGHIAKSNVNMLSAGQKQLVALAGILVMKPKYIVFDEPTTLLDPKNKKNILRIINQLNKKDRITIILVTNIIADLRHADNIIIISDGKIIFNGKKNKLNKKIIKKAGLDA